MTIKNKEGVTIGDVFRAFFDSIVEDDNRGLPVCVSILDEGERSAKLLADEVGRLRAVFDVLET